MRKFLSFLLASLLAITPAYAGISGGGGGSANPSQYTVYKTSISAETVPSWASNATFTLCGGGGGGGGGITNGVTGGGGGGTGQCIVFNTRVNPGDTLTFNIGAGGTGGAVGSPGAIGGDTTVTGATVGEYYTAFGGGPGCGGNATCDNGKTASALAGGGGMAGQTSSTTPAFNPVATTVLLTPYEYQSAINPPGTLGDDATGIGSTNNSRYANSSYPYTILRSMQTGANGGSNGIKGGDSWCHTGMVLGGAIVTNGGGGAGGSSIFGCGGAGGNGAAVGTGQPGFDATGYASGGGGGGAAGSNTTGVGGDGSGGLGIVTFYQ